MNFSCNPANRWRIVMRINLIFLILLSAIMQLSAKGYSQITLKVANAKLSDVFVEIRKQSGYDFFYNEGLIESTNPITLDLKNASIEATLASCLENEALEYSIKNNIVVIKSKPTTHAVVIREANIPTQATQQASHVIRGKVTNSQGFGIPGTSVRVKNREDRAVTDIKGMFQLNLPVDTGTIIVNF